MRDDTIIFIIMGIMAGFCLSWFSDMRRSIDDLDREIKVIEEKVIELEHREGIKVPGKKINWEI